MGVEQQPRVVYSAEFQDFQVKVVTDCLLYKDVEIKAESPLVFEKILSFGEVLTVTGKEVAGEDSEFVFYPVLYIDNEQEFNGFVIKNFVMREDASFLRNRLDPNAEVKKTAQIYFDKNDEAILQIKNENVVLEKSQKVKVIDNSDRHYKKIMFELDSEIYVGYIKSENVIIEGFNSAIVSAVFIFILAGSIALSIFLTTRKKRKNQTKI